MALLNYKSQYSADLLQLTSALIFTEDGHIVARGLDYSALFTNTNTDRGLVPKYDTKLDDYAVLGKDGWQKLTSDYIPIASVINADATTSFATAAQIFNFVNGQFAANDAMRFMGGVSTTEDLENIQNYSAGWTYRVTSQSDGSLPNIMIGTRPCELGDLIIAQVEDARTDKTKIQDSDWCVVQTNINGTNTININGKEYTYFTDGIETDLTIYAPTTKGSTDQVLLGDLSWGSISNLSVAEAATASKVEYSLTLGDGLAYNNGTSFDGSVARQILLSQATKNSIGGVIVGDNISVANGIISVPVVSDTANGVMTPELFAQLTTNTKNITANADAITALQNLVDGLTSFNSVAVGSNTLSAADAENKLKIEGAGISIYNKKLIFNTATSSAGGLMSKEDKQTLDNLGTTVNTTISTELEKLRYFSTIGGISASSAGSSLTIEGSGFTTNSNKIIITDTTYSFEGGVNTLTVTPSDGTAQTITITPNITSNVTYSGTPVDGNIAIFDGITGVIKDSGFTINSSVPANAKFTDTWRPIYLEAETTAIASDKPLRLTSGEGLVMVQDNTNTTEIEIGFDLRWYNLDDNTYDN